MSALETTWESCGKLNFIREERLDVNEAIPNVEQTKLLRENVPNIPTRFLKIPVVFHIVSLKYEK